MAVVELTQLPGLTRAQRRQVVVAAPVIGSADLDVPTELTLATAPGATRAERRRAVEAAAAPANRKELRLQRLQDRRRSQGVGLLLRSWWFYAIGTAIALCAVAAISSASTPLPTSNMIISQGTQGEPGQ